MIFLSQYQEGERRFSCGRYVGPSEHSCERDGWIRTVFQNERMLEDEMDELRGRLQLVQRRFSELIKALPRAQARLSALVKVQGLAVNSFNRAVMGLK